MSTKLKELRETRSDKLDAMGQLDELANAETRDLTDDEKTEWDKLDGEVTDLDTQIADEEKREATREKIKANDDKKNLGKKNLGKNPQQTPENEAREQYNILTMINQVIDDKRLSGIYREMHDEARREASIAGTQVNNFGIPAMICRSEKRDMTAGTGSEGGDLIVTFKPGIIEDLTDAMVLRQAGAQFFTDLQGLVVFPTESNSITSDWKAETTTLAETSPTIGTVSLAPEKVGTYVEISNELRLQTSPDIANRISARLTNSLARAIDQAGIDGSGSTPVPEGITNTTGIGDVAGGTNGLALTYANVLAIIQEVAVDNALIGKLGWLLNTKTVSSIMAIDKGTDTGQFLMQAYNSPLAGWPVHITNQVPSDLTKGSSSVASAAIFGNFDDLVIGMWGGLDILVDPFSLALTGLTRVIGTAYADVAILNPESFSASLDVLTA